MPLYNLMEYNSNYSETTRILWLCCKDDATNLNINIANDNHFKFFEGQILKKYSCSVSKLC